MRKAFQASVLLVCAALTEHHLPCHAPGLEHELHELQLHLLVVIALRPSCDLFNLLLF